MTKNDSSKKHVIGEACFCGDYHCPCGWSRIILDPETWDDARIAHEKTEIHRIEMKRK